MVVGVVLLAQWAQKKLRIRKILNPLPSDMDARRERVEIEVEPPLDQGNSATTSVAAESKVEDSTAEKKIRLSPQKIETFKKKREL